MTATHALGLDIGGSSVKAALVRGDAVLVTAIRPIDQARQPGAVVGTLAAVADEMRGSWGQVDTIGVALPGLYDADTGVPTLLPNFPAVWHGYPFRSAAEEALGQQVTLANDAKAFSVAESLLGAGRGHRAVACFVLGTGVGGGVIIDGKLWRGAGYAGEFGHLSVDLDGPRCGCGNHGCVESYASAAAICAAAGQASVDKVFEASRAGDPAALAAIGQAVRALAAGMANVFVAIAPDRIVIGGGVATAGDELFGPLRDAVRERVLVADPDLLQVVPASLGRFAGAIGAALSASSGSGLADQS